VLTEPVSKQGCVDAGKQSGIVSCPSIHSFRRKGGNLTGLLNSTPLASISRPLL